MAKTTNNGHRVEKIAAGNYYVHTTAGAFALDNWTRSEQRGWIVQHTERTLVAEVLPTMAAALAWIDATVVDMLDEQRQTHERITARQQAEQPAIAARDQVCTQEWADTYANLAAQYQQLQALAALPPPPPRLGQAWVTKVTQSDGPELSALGGEPAPPPRRTEDEATAAQRALQLPTQTVRAQQFSEAYAFDGLVAQALQAGVLIDCSYGNDMMPSVCLPRVAGATEDTRQLFVDAADPNDSEACEFGQRDRDFRYLVVESYDSMATLYEGNDEDEAVRILTEMR